MERGDGHTEAMSLWSIQESLLQTYRSIFITAESIVLAVAAAIATLNPPSALVLTLLGYILLWMWHKVTSNRAIDVSFVQWLLLRAEAGDAISAPVTLLKRFQAGGIVAIGDRSVWRHENRPPEGELKDETFTSLSESPSRTRMEVFLPCFFGLLWTIVAYLAIREMFQM